MRSQLFIAATGKYIRFVPDLVHSAEKYFLPELKHNREYVIFTDNRLEEPNNSLIDTYGRRILFIPSEHVPFPHATTNRWNCYAKHMEENIGDLSINNYAFQIDADARFVTPISLNDILPENKPYLACAVTHCAHVGKLYADLPFEKYPQSESFVAPGLRTYYGGGFFGGVRSVFAQVCVHVYNKIKVDQERGYMPVWHDESALNSVLNGKGLAGHLNTLPVDYHAPEHWQEGILPHVKAHWDELGLKVTPRILFLDKYRGNSNGANQLRY